VLPTSVASLTRWPLPASTVIASSQTARLVTRSIVWPSPARRWMPSGKKRISRSRTVLRLPRTTNSAGWRLAHCSPGHSEHSPSHDAQMCAPAYWRIAPRPSNTVAVPARQSAFQRSPWSSPQLPRAVAGAVGSMRSGIGVAPQVVAASGPIRSVTSGAAQRFTASSAARTSSSAHATKHVAPGTGQAVWSTPLQVNAATVPGTTTIPTNATAIPSRRDIRPRRRAGARRVPRAAGRVARTRGVARAGACQTADTGRTICADDNY
jgi:hypothetical protein